MTGRGFLKWVCTGFVLVILAFGVSVTGYSQDLGSVDFESLRSSDLSDQQVQQLWGRAQEEGYSLQELQQLALARGMAAAEVSDLVSRVRNLRTGGGPETGTTTSGIQTRQTQQVSAPQGGGSRSNIFGAELFNRQNISFAPNLNIPTPETYQLGTGDELVIDMWGAVEETYRLQISQEGTISLPRVGPVYLNGMEIKEARVRLKDELSNIYSSLNARGEEMPETHLRISLGQIRSISVTVMGNAAVPGSYTLPSLATAFNALYMSGGPGDNGSFRSIKIIRDDSVRAVMDVYNFLVYGEQPNNIRLRDQDIIKIDPYISHVDLSGRTKRTGVFELKEGETLRDLITYAGGFDEGAYIRRMKIIRETPTQKEIKDLRYPEQQDFMLKNGDEVTVGNILNRFDNRVAIEGAVYRPGEFELNDTTTLYSLVQRAEGLRPDVFTNRGLIYRNPDNIETEVISFDLREVMKNLEEHDIPLVKNDRVVISSISELRDQYSVTVTGAVHNSGSFSYAKGMTLKDAVLQADGFRDDAAPYRVEIARRITDTDSAYVPNEIVERFSFSVDEDLSLTEEDASFILHPFDRVYVRSSPAYYQQQEVTIRGQVLFPGTYSLNSQNTRISDLVEMAGGVTRFAYTPGASLSRINQRDVDPGSINDTLSSAAGLASNRTAVGINFDRIMNNPGSEYDLLLEEGDILEIPKELETVKVAGEVLYPVTVRYEPGRSFKSYVRAAGGVNNQGKLKDAYVVYANGEVDRTNKFLFFRDYPDVRRGATIIIPQKEERPRLSPQERIGILTSIVSMAAIVSNVLR